MQQRHNKNWSSIYSMVENAWDSHNKIVAEIFC